MFGQLVESPVLAAQSSHQPASHGSRSASQQAPGTAVSSKVQNAESPQQLQQQSQHKKQKANGQLTPPQLQALHVDGLYPDYIKLLSKPFEMFHFDFAHPPEDDGYAQLQASARHQPTQQLTNLYLRIAHH